MTTIIDGDKWLLEDGDYYLQEDGSKILLTALYGEEVSGAQTNTGVLNRITSVIYSGAISFTGAILRLLILVRTTVTGAITFVGTHLWSMVAKGWEVYLWPTISKMVTLMKKGLS